MASASNTRKEKHGYLTSTYLQHHNPVHQPNEKVKEDLPQRSQQVDLTAFLATEEHHSWNSKSGWGREGAQEITQGSLPQLAQDQVQTHIFLARLLPNP